MRAALSKTAAPRHKNNKRGRRRLGSHADREIFHVSHPLTFKWTAPTLRSARAAAVKIFISEISPGQRYACDPEHFALGGGGVNS